MSEEEKKAIEMLNKYIAEHKFFNIRQADNLEGNIEISINLIEKQQKEIDLCEETEIALNNRILDLEEINKKHQKLNGELREEIERQGNTREIEEKYKDKIREKIELLLKANKLMTEEQRQKETEYMQGKLRAYEELLEEE